MCILDEYGYYAVQGFAVVPAQARSLGFSAIFAGQDLPAFQKTSKEEAASIGANTNIKICMKLEDPTETWDFFTKTAGEAYVTKVDSFQTKENSISNSYADTKSSSYEKRARVDLLDLKDQSEGEAHVFFRSKIVRARMFYANPTPVSRLKLNQFLKVEPPPDAYLNKLKQQLEVFHRVLMTEDFSMKVAEKNEELDAVVDLYSQVTLPDKIGRAVDVLLRFYKRNQPEEVAEIVQERQLGVLNIFSALDYPATLPKLLAKDVTGFSAPLLVINRTRDLLLTIEQLSGEKDKLAGTIANEVIKDLQLVTTYPPQKHVVLAAGELVQVVGLINARIQKQHQANKLNEQVD
jgi:intracellular multiplication protein IcmO